MASLAQQLISVEYMYVYYTQLPDGEDEDGQTYKAMLLREYELLLEDYQVLSEEVAEEAADDADVVSVDIEAVAAQLAEEE